MLDHYAYNLKIRKNAIKNFSKQKPIGSVRPHQSGHFDHFPFHLVVSRNHLGYFPLPILEKKTRSLYYENSKFIFARLRYGGLKIFLGI